MTQDQREKAIEIAERAFDIASNFLFSLDFYHQLSPESNQENDMEKPN